MTKKVSSLEYAALAEVRYRIRCFLEFSEGKARAVGLEPQQHQLLLAVCGLPADLPPTIGNVAERLRIQHHSAVELVRRCERNGLVEKNPSPYDRREVHLSISARGKRLLEKLAVVHRTELRTMAPMLLRAMGALL
jgi:DNA-binding MarR family transcriptional regulator